MKKTINITRIFSFLLAFVPIIVQADPGHGLEDISGWSLLHFITAPKHALPIGILLLIGIVFICRKSIKKFTNKKDHFE